MIVLACGTLALTLDSSASNGADAPTADRAAAVNPEAAALRRQLLRERRLHRAELSRARREGPRHVSKALAIAAAAYGVPAVKLARVARCESTFNPNARNGPYLGLFQFGTELWKTTPYRRFSRSDPYAASLAAAWAFDRGMASHWPVCGRR